MTFEDRIDNHHVGLRELYDRRHHLAAAVAIVREHCPGYMDVVRALDRPYQQESKAVKRETSIAIERKIHKMESEITTMEAEIVAAERRVAEGRGALREALATARLNSPAFDGPRQMVDDALALISNRRGKITSRKTKIRNLRVQLPAAGGSQGHAAAMVAATVGPPPE